MSETGFFLALMRWLQAEEEGRAEPTAEPQPDHQPVSEGESGE